MPKVRSRKGEKKVERMYYLTRTGKTIRVQFGLEGDVLALEVDMINVKGPLETEEEKEIGRVGGKGDLEDVGGWTAK